MALLIHKKACKRLADDFSDTQQNQAMCLTAQSLKAEGLAIVNTRPGRFKPKDHVLESERRHEATLPEGIRQKLAQDRNR